MLDCGFAGRGCTPRAGCSARNRVRPPGLLTWSRRGRDDRRHALQRPRLPMGLFGQPATPGDRVALRRPARMAARPGRPDRGRPPVRGARLHADAGSAGPGMVPPPLWDAVLGRGEAVPQRHLARVPRGDRRAPRPPRKRVAGFPRAAIRQLHDADAARRRRAPGPCAPGRAGDRRELPRRKNRCARRL